MEVNQRSRHVRLSTPTPTSGNHQRMESFKCEGWWPHDKNNPCPAINEECKYCHKLGHLEKTCFSKKNEQRRVIKTNATVRSRQHSTESEPILSVEIFSTGNKYLGNNEAIADTGAQTSVAGQKFITNLKLQDQLTTPLYTVMGIKKQPLNTLGCVTLKICAGSEEYTDVITICEEITKPNLYLSLKTLKALKIVDEDFPKPKSPKIRSKQLYPIRQFRRNKGENHDGIQRCFQLRRTPPTHGR